MYFSASFINTTKNWKEKKWSNAWWWSASHWCTAQKGLISCQHICSEINMWFSLQLSAVVAEFVSFDWAIDYLSFNHEEAMVALLFWINSYLDRLNFMHSELHLTSFHVNLLLVRNLLAEIIIIKRLHARMQPHNQGVGSTEISWSRSL